MEQYGHVSSAPRRRLNARSLAALAALAASCVASPGGDDTTADAGPPPKVKRPPAAKEGSATAPHCEGVTERGECTDGMAVYCDVARDELRRVDCAALDKACVLDPVRGAKCEVPAPGAGAGAGCGEVDDVGFCDGGVAVWCSIEEEDTLVQWNCAADGKRCSVDECMYGAYCCGEGAPPPGECPVDLDEAGYCTGPGNNIATWCDSDGVVFEVDCAATGERCELDTCAYGAYCCGNSTPATGDCDALGWRGECDGDIVRFCTGGEVVEDDCATEGLSCEVDGCGAGANCCEPTSVSPECEALGWAGDCVGDLLRYCDGVDIVELDCTKSGRACEVDGCTAGEANCCESNVSECEALGWEGECAGDIVRYCNGAGEIIEINCGASGDSCVFDGCWTGAAACCDA